MKMTRNMLPVKYNRGITKEIILCLLAISLFLGAVLGIYYGVTAYLQGNMEKEVEELTEENGAIREEVLVLTERVEEHRYYQEVSERMEDGEMEISSVIPDVEMNQFFVDVQEARNEALLFSRIHIEEKGNITIEGQAYDFKDISKFYHDLDALVEYDIHLEYVDVHPFGGGINHALKEAVSFIITGEQDVEDDDEADEEEEEEA